MYWFSRDLSYSILYHLLVFSCSSTVIGILWYRINLQVVVNYSVPGNMSLTKKCILVGNTRCLESIGVVLVRFLTAHKRESIGL